MSASSIMATGASSTNPPPPFLWDGSIVPGVGGNCHKNWAFLLSLSWKRWLSVERGQMDLSPFYVNCTLGHYFAHRKVLTMSPPSLCPPPKEQNSFLSYTNVRSLF